MRVIVPYDGEDPKTRLSELLGSEERKEFARAMLRDVLEAVRSVDASPLVLSPSPVGMEECDVCVDDRPLTPAVSERLRSSSEPTAVVMADLPLIEPETLRALFSCPGDVVLARGLGGGTNALVSRTTGFTVDYHGNSYLDHRAIADDIGASVGEIDSYRLATDVDEPDDLAEVLLHGDGRARRWLREAGFELDPREGRCDVRRTDRGVVAEPRR